MAKDKRTFHGLPCKYGHTLRYISSPGNCVECTRARARLRNPPKGTRPNHGYSKAGKNPHPVYKIWEAMIARCENPHSRSYKYYGAKGITVCDHWRHSFPAFLADMGERPSLDHSIERIDSDGNYEPTNVIWATRTEQSRNRPNYVKHSIETARMIRALYATGITMQAIADQFGVTKQSVWLIIHNKVWKE